MRVEYQMLDGQRAYGELDTLRMGDRIGKPIPLDTSWVCEGSAEACALSPPMLTRSYRVTGFETVAILKEMF
jgi:hypothetical protein